MKILVIGTGGAIVSGITTAADQMATTLKGLGCGVDRMNAGERMRRRANTLNLENCFAALADAVAVFYRARGKKADLVWIHVIGVPALPALRALAMVAAARAAGRPTVVHFHAFGLERSLAEGGRLLRMVLRALASLASAMVVVHEAAAQALGGIVGNSAAMNVVHNWVDVPDDMAAPPPLPPLRMVFVGGLVRRKGAPQLIDAMRELGDISVELRLVGGAGEDGVAALDQLLAAAGDLVLGGRVSFAGELDAPGVRAELRAAHLFVLPSAAEGMPLSMVEAMAEGRAVLVTDAGNMAAVVEEAGCGWVLANREPATIAAGVRQAAEDVPALLAASRAGWRAASERYSAQTASTKIGAILASVLVRQ